MRAVTGQNIALVRRWFDEVWNQGKMERIAELAAPDAVAHGHAPYDVDMDQFKVFYQSVRSAFPDIHLAIDFTVAESDKVVARWTAAGTHSGSFLGYAPTGKAINVSGITIARISGGKIVEAWDTWDQLGLLVQIGAALGPEFFKPPAKKT